MTGDGPDSSLALLAPIRPTNSSPTNSSCQFVLPIRPTNSSCPRARFVVPIRRRHPFNSSPPALQFVAGTPAIRRRHPFILSSSRPQIRRPPPRKLVVLDRELRRHAQGRLEASPESTAEIFWRRRPNARGQADVTLELRHVGDHTHVPERPDLDALLQVARQVTTPTLQANTSGPSISGGGRTTSRKPLSFRVPSGNRLV